MITLMLKFFIATVCLGYCANGAWGANRYDNPPLSDRKTLDAVDLKTKTTEELIAIYTDMLQSNPFRWHPDAQNQLTPFIKNSTDEKMDGVLIELAKSIIKKNEENNSLDYGNPKKTPTSSEKIIAMLCARKTKACNEFILSLSKHPKPVIRNSVAEYLIRKMKDDPEDEQLQQSVLEFLKDKDANVVYFTASYITREEIDRHKTSLLISKDIAEALVSARDDAKDGVKLCCGSVLKKE